MTAKRTLAEIQANAEGLAQKFMDFEPPVSLNEFLLARIAEDEAAAKAITTRMYYAYAEPNPEREAWVDHIHRHEPGLVLEECDAKRRIVEDRGFRVFTEPSQLSIFGARILGYLALPYASHPDYREEWKQ